ncbi:MAG TPA: MerR family transcriptional regulator [Albitalea sp.]
MAPPIAPGFLHIGELSRRTGRSIYTIRWYEQQKLIPGVRRDAAGRRIYREQHVTWLDLLDRLRLSGMSIRQIREYAQLVRRGDATLEQRREMLRAHRELVDRQMAQLAAARAVIDGKIDFYARWLREGRQPA